MPLTALTFPNDIFSISPDFGLSAKAWSALGKLSWVGVGGEEKGGSSKALLGSGKPHTHTHTHTYGLTLRWRLRDLRKHSAPGFRSAFKTPFLVVRHCTNLPAPRTASSSTVKWGTVEVKYVTVCEDAL